MSTVAVGTEPSTAIKNAHLHDVNLECNNLVGWGLYCAYLNNRCSVGNILVSRAKVWGIQILYNFDTSFGDLWARLGEEGGIAIGSNADAGSAWNATNKSVNNCTFTRLGATNNGTNYTAASPWVKSTDQQKGCGVLLNMDNGNFIQQIRAESNRGAGLVLGGGNDGTLIASTYLEANNADENGLEFAGSTYAYQFIEDFREGGSNINCYRFVKIHATLGSISGTLTNAEVWFWMSGGDQITTTGDYLAGCPKIMFDDITAVDGFESDHNEWAIGQVNYVDIKEDNIVGQRPRNILNSRYCDAVLEKVRFWLKGKERDITAINDATFVGARTFSTDFATSTSNIDSTAHDFNDGDEVVLTTTGTLPTGLSLATTYYVINSSTDDFELSLTPGGSAVTFSDDGTGTHTATESTKTIISLSVPNPIAATSKPVGAVMELWLNYHYHNEDVAKYGTFVRKFLVYITRMRGANTLVKILPADAPVQQEMSDSVDLSGAATAVPILLSNRPVYVLQAGFLYDEASSADAGITLEIGDSSDADKFFTGTSEGSRSQWDLRNQTLLANSHDAGVPMLLTSAGGKTGTGQVRAVVEYITEAESDNFGYSENNNIGDRTDEFLYATDLSAKVESGGTSDTQTVVIQISKTWTTNDAIGRINAVAQLQDLSWIQTDSFSPNIVKFS
jgi:hypothetical protein